MELAHQLSQPHGPYAKSQVARALGLARGTLYLHSKQAEKDKRVAIAIETWHEQDDTLGHRKLAALLHMGKNRVKRVMKKYGLSARRKKKRYVYPGKASHIAPNLLRSQEVDGTETETESQVTDASQQTEASPEVIFSDIFEVCPGCLGRPHQSAGMFCPLETDEAYPGAGL